MGIFAQCFGCGQSSLVPADHTDLTRDELKRLYERSIALNDGRLIVHGIFARADTKNNNKRVYPKYILKREVTKFLHEHIRKGTSLGELDHPNYASRYFKCLNLPNVSHQVLDVHWRGDQLWGTIEVLATPSGLLLWELYSQGIKLGVSSRGWASLRTDPRAKCVFVDEDFELITFDFVTEPSTHGAFLVPIHKPYNAPIPNQSKAVQIAHLGHGVASMRNICRLPAVATLVQRINELQAKPSPSLQAPKPVLLAESGVGLLGLLAPRAHALDQLLLFSHYLVFPLAPYLEREQHMRDFQAHLAMFATRAHLSDQQAALGRTDLNAIILKEIAREEAAEEAAGGQIQQEQQVRASDTRKVSDHSSHKSREGITVNAPSELWPPLPGCSAPTPINLSVQDLHSRPVSDQECKSEVHAWQASQHADDGERCGISELFAPATVLAAEVAVSHTLAATAPMARQSLNQQIHGGWHGSHSSSATYGAAAILAGLPLGQIQLQPQPHDPTGRLVGAMWEGSQDPRGSGAPVTGQEASPALPWAAGRPGSTPATSLAAPFTTPAPSPTQHFASTETPLIAATAWPPQQQRQGPGQAVVCGNSAGTEMTLLEAEVVAELGRIKITLSAFAIKYAAKQQHLRSTHHVQLPFSAFHATTLSVG